MLYTETVEKGTFELLAGLMRDPVLDPFFLVGGTALSLQIGHRKSVDLDLFTHSDFDTESLRDHLHGCYGFVPSAREKNTLKGTIRGTAVDCITYRYPLVQPLVTTQEGIRLASLDDIAAMKLSAIVNDGSRMKDFIDVACLSSRMPLTRMLQAYRQKFGVSETFTIYKALNYHADIESGAEVLMMAADFSWEKTAEHLRRMTLEPEKIFPQVSRKSRNKIRLRRSPDMER